MLGGSKKQAHAIVALSVLVASLLAAWGLIGESHVDEHIEQLQVVVSPAGETGVRITETMDYDFGTNDRRGPQLIVPTDLGILTEVTATSDGAPDDLHVGSAWWDGPTDAMFIRVGDPDVTVRGQHRYTISYVLPRALASGPFLFLDAVGAESEIPIERVTVVVDGFELEEPTCSAGATGTSGGCAFEPGAPLRVAVDRLEPREGITISGEVVGRSEPVGVEPPPILERRQDHRQRTALLVAVLGAVVAIATYVWSVRTGANEVMGLSAAEAAHGTGLGGPDAVREVTDAELEELAAIEFAPPQGLEPWQGRLVLTEVLDASLISAWFSGAIANGLIEVRRAGTHPRLGRGTPDGDVDPFDLQVLDTVFAGRDAIDLLRYDPKFARGWAQIGQHQAEWARTCGWWSRPLRPGNRKPGSIFTFGVLVVAAVVLVVASSFLLGLLGFVGGVVTALVVGAGLPFIVARVAYAPLRPGRTAAGSAWAIRTESFRRFLADSEGQHVQWAWDQGLLRQYSAWAVALDAADAWKEGLERAGVPQPEIDGLSPLTIPRMQSAFTDARTTTSSISSGRSGSSGGGGGRSGRVGGGGGGGSRGSW